MKTPILLLFSLLTLYSCKKDSDFKNAPDNADELHNKNVGASARDLLSLEKYKSLVVEMQFMPGFTPDAAAANELRLFLEARLNKPGGIIIEMREIAASGSTTLSAADLKTIENNNRTAFTSGDRIALYVLYTNGAYTNANTLGVAYRNTSAAIFGKTARDNSGGIGQASRTKLETTVLTHEIGHLLGLVDIGTPMVTNHIANGNHCNNSNCLMYYTAETTDILGFLITGSIPQLDANCVNDLKANGGK